MQQYSAVGCMNEATTTVTRAEMMINQTKLFFFIPSILVVALIWLPFGFQLTGLIEEWDMLALFTKNGLFFWAGADSPLAEHRLRPLTILPHALAYSLNSDSFFYWHLLQMLSLILKGTAASIIAWFITRSRGWAIFLGMLIILYPADTMQLAFRGIHINFSLALILFASAMLVIAYDQPRRVIRFGLALSAAISLGAAILMYEAALFLAPMPFLIIFAHVGIKHTWTYIRTYPWLSLSWMIAVCLCIIHAIFVFSHGDNYQLGVVGGEAGLMSALHNQVPKLFSIGLLRSLAGGWFDAARIVLFEYINYSYLVFVTAVYATTSYIRHRIFQSDIIKNYEDKVTDRQLPLRIMSIGLLLSVLGYLPYLSSNAHIHISQRTYLFVAPGAAIVLLACLILLARIRKWIAEVIGFTLLLLGMGAQLFQFHHYQRISDTQRQILRTIVENFDGNVGNKTLLILDGTEQINHTWMLNNISNVLSYFYNKPINSVEICLMPNHNWQRNDSLARNGTCVEDSDRWIFKTAPPVSGPGFVSPQPSPDLVINKDNVVTIRINADGSVDQDLALIEYRTQLKSGTGHASDRYRNILVVKPWPLDFKQFTHIEEQSSYRWDFGRWWSMEVPIHGSGWREAEWEVNHFFHRAMAWKSQGISSLLFKLAPTNKPYVLRGEFDSIVSESIRNSIHIRLNGHDLEYHWIMGNKFETLIPDNALRRGLNRVEFNSATDANYFGLSARLVWLEVDQRQK